MLEKLKYENILKSSFIHMKGIGPKTEKNLWTKGIVNWDELELFAGGNQLYFFNDNNSNPLIKKINESRLALQNTDADFFANNLLKREHYRIVLTFFKNTIFLDIETTGLSKYYDYITVIGWSYKGKYNYCIKGDDTGLLEKCLSEAKCIVTFNGSIFDIPFLKKEIKNINIPKTHVDLRFFSRRVGLSGGQKEIEKKLKIKRPPNIEEIDGKAATILWYKYLKGNLSALKSLIKYNYYDVIGMEIIFDELVKRLEKLDCFPPHTNPIYHFRKNKKIPRFKLSIPENDWINKQKLLNKSSVSISLKELVDLSIHNKIKVIGIDLTGSEKRASGCCLLSKNIAYTKLIKTDAEIIRYVLKYKPTIVSIDSPLSLPKGRKTVDDDDPGPKKYGIMRQCERELKKRGVNVYPSLIPSMQKLTQRGIMLADTFRRLGIPVIESFPGAAQDIMKIPRKRTDLSMLKEGLIEFGIKGKLRNNDISHDELDGITSALVGYFFWYGKFEALGNPDEEFLIIPDIITDSVWTNRVIIGLSGPMATGKTTAGKELETKGFYYTRFSLILEKLLKKQSKKVNRHNLQELGLQIKERGQRKLCMELYQNIPEKGNVVIDGLRHPEDHTFLVEFFGPDFLHIYIESPLHFRRQRYINMDKSALEFDNAVCHKVEANVSNLSEFAHLKVTNDKSIKDFQLTINNILKTVHK